MWCVNDQNIHQHLTIPFGALAFQPNEKVSQPPDRKNEREGEARDDDAN